MHYDDLKDIVSGSNPAPSEFPVVSLGKTLKPPQRGWQHLSWQPPQYVSEGVNETPLGADIVLEKHFV